MRHRNGIRSVCLRFFKKKDGKTLIHTHKYDLLHDPHHVREAADGSFKGVILHFKIARANVSESRASITFSTPTIEGTVLRRNKADTRGKHPWKAEVTEGDNATATTITNWYKEVYEPTYGTTSGTGGSN